MKIEMINCTVCNHGEAKVIFNKGGYDYLQCSHCKSILVPDGINQEGKVGGGFEIERNVQQNAERIRRFKELVGKYGKVLDWGAGHNLLVNDCIGDGMYAVGYDKFNPELSNLPQEKFNLVCLVEVVEHLYGKFSEFDIIYDLLYDRGVIYMESSFVDIIEPPYEEAYYIEPEVGHCTIFSHYGLDRLMIRKGFKVLPPINANVRLYQKITK